MSLILSRRGLYGLHQLPSGYNFITPIEYIQEEISTAM